MQQSIALFVFVSLAVVHGSSSLRLGGVQDEHPASEASPQLRKELDTRIRQQFTEASGSKPEMFELVSFATQIVAGTNYFVKVKTGESDYVHLRIFEPLPYRHEPMHLHSYQKAKNLGDPIEYFEKTE